MDAAREALAELLFDRVAADPALPNAAGELVLAAFDGSTELAQALAGTVDDRPTPVRDRPEPTDVPGIYLRSIGVTGFRGIGPRAQLNLRPGPGLTIVTGRNGSGKSSFAEAVELALTGANKRWSDPSERGLAVGLAQPSPEHWDGARRGAGGRGRRGADDGRPDLGR